MSASEPPSTASASEPSSTERERLLLRVERGAPDESEMAALTAVITVLAGTGAARDEPGEPSVWADRSALVRRPLRPGPGAWRASGFPR
ncbi:MAG: acyl-CoA carboxylase subunit epsilon [Kutzneria sp.]|nr:acyl-CoA carboxylase subunit epsilon [Kutzneria sp.]